MGQSILTTAGAEADWLAISPSEAGFNIRPRRAARQAMGGTCGDRRVVPARWIERSTLPMVDVDEIRQYG